MKLIIAYIQPESLNDVNRRSMAPSLQMSVDHALGCGQQCGYHESYVVLTLR
jgi:nitrogen regulatory protein PII